MRNKGDWFLGNRVGSPANMIDTQHEKILVKGQEVATHIERHCRNGHWGSREGGRAVMVQGGPAAAERRASKRQAAPTKLP
jgi:hypothetical protein